MTGSPPRWRCSRCIPTKPVVRLRTTIANQDCVVVLDGDAHVYREPVRWAPSASRGVVVDGVQEATGRVFIGRSDQHTNAL